MIGEAHELPAKVNSVLTEFIASTKNAFKEDLQSIVLYGSGAEGKLRPASDVNVIVVLSKFDQNSANQMHEPLRLAEAAIKLKAMFLLEEELRPATQAFAVKFADVLRRRRVLYGDDPFASLSVSREDAIFRLKQTLLNLTLRLRESYISRGLREEQLIATIVDAAGPLRSCAATLLELEEVAAPTPKDALQQISSSLPGAEKRNDELQLISAARERRNLPPGMAAPILFHLIELARLMWARAAALK
ncbi:MAG TPA: nucleotidyltransferase domain-containing protein [Pyrinomonadaceae bacterium]|jgi:predicted nucleotidyltransferase|nr:nucleotidyltransferase domain-containing protein [Pyrinomonadaceae bacterium]